MAATAHPLAPTALDPATLDRMRACYLGVDDARVSPFLREHPELAIALVDAAPRLFAAFGAGVTLRLERSYFDNEELLFARVYGHASSVDEAEQRMDGFREGWWYQQPPEAARFLEFSVGWDA